MINRRLVQSVSESKRYIAAQVALQWISLLANIALMLMVTQFLAALLQSQGSAALAARLGLVAVAALLIRYLCSMAASRMSFLASQTVKKKMRSLLYEKLLRLGSRYQETMKTSEIVQVAVEGVDQLETYFGAYLPQFFYAMVAPLTLFLLLSQVNLPVAVVLLICVPLIPVAIALVQTLAKKLLARYWGQYTALGDTFLENLQGLTTLKIYQSDAFKQKEMEEQSEHFRKITMKVLSMQLNSITIMDLVAYGGAALGVILSLTQFQAGHMTLSGCLLTILISAEFFIPMRQLGSFFHVAMNGMAASEKMFRLLDAAEPERPEVARHPQRCDLVCEAVSFSYEAERPLLHEISASFPQGSVTAIVGESGCGKSTLAALLIGQLTPQSGRVTLGGIDLSHIEEAERWQRITYVSHRSYLFKGTVRENLLMGRQDASEGELWQALEKTRLAAFFREKEGLDTLLTEQAANLSGGQRQRLALARALLHNSPLYILDEASSNIDIESENAIMEATYQLAESKTVILISHRLANVTRADRIYVMEQGRIAESGSHEELLSRGGCYAKLFHTQQELEQYGKEKEAV